MTVIEQLNNTELEKGFTNISIKDFWIHKLKSLKPHEFNAELNNFPNPYNFCIFSTSSISQKALCRKDCSNTTGHSRRKTDVKFVINVNHQC